MRGVHSVNAQRPRLRTTGFWRRRSSESCVRSGYRHTCATRPRLMFQTRITVDHALSKTWSTKALTRRRLSLSFLRFFWRWRWWRNISWNTEHFEKIAVPCQIAREPNIATAVRPIIESSLQKFVDRYEAGFCRWAVELNLINLIIFESLECTVQNDVLFNYPSK